MKIRKLQGIVVDVERTGEYITDERVLALPEALPPGEYRLLAGLYVPGGARLTTADGRDAIPITPITVEAP